MNADTLRRQAYVDEQLSVDEVLDFEEKLTPEARRQLDRERAFEQAFVEHLREDDAPGCPEALWRDLSSRIARSEDPAASEPVTRFSWLGRVLAVAAAIVLAATVVTRVIGPGESALVAVGQMDNLAEFAAQAEIRGGVTEIRDALAAAGFTGVELAAPDEQAYHQIAFYGMRKEVINGKPAARLYLSCCGRPTTAIITAAEQAVAFDESEIRGTAYKASKKLGAGHRVTLVSPHPVEEALDLFG